MICSYMSAKSEDDSLVGGEDHVAAIVDTRRADSLHRKSLDGVGCEYNH
jgi:hypothetical protein